ncbi:hypothetical protein TMatcc_009427 [Talaromyces marneffei ATCC 18224]
METESQDLIHFCSTWSVGENSDAFRKTRRATHINNPSEGIKVDIAKAIYLHPLRALGRNWISIGHRTTPLMKQQPQQEVV